jgi:hypothetical protein
VAVSLFRRWQQARNSERLLQEDHQHIFKSIDDLTKSELDYLLSFFILEVRTENGEKFKSNSLKGLIAMIQYHFNKSLNKGWSIFNDGEFQKTVVEETHEKILWDKNILGSDSPRRLLFTYTVILIIVSPHECRLNMHIRSFTLHSLNRNFMQ